MEVLEERKIKQDDCMGNPHSITGDGCNLRNEAEVREWLAKNLRVTVRDDSIIQDKNQVGEQIVKVGQIIYDGLPKIKKG